MPIDFHSPDRRTTYVRPGPGPEWRHGVLELLDPVGARVVDLGCGGGTYTAAWRDLGAAHVTAVDFSTEILAGAREHLGDDDPAITFHLGEASATGLPPGGFDVVFARALIHHLDDHAGFAREAARLLAPGGHLVVQDRTVEDVELPPSREHLRGFFFGAFPRLLDVERARRPRTSAVGDTLRAAGFDDVRSERLWETRRAYTGPDEIAADLRARTGRSLLFELEDRELEDLVAHVLDHVGDGALVERDPWTVWSARRR